MSHCGPLLPAHCGPGLPSVAIVATASCSPALGVDRYPPTGPPTSCSKLYDAPCHPALRSKPRGFLLTSFATPRGCICFKSGVDIAVIALWLGHESLDTTHMYVKADLKTKEQALEKLQAVAGGFLRFKPDDALLAFLSAL